LKNSTKNQEKMITKKTSIKESIELNQLNESVLLRYGIPARKELSIGRSASNLVISTDFLVDILNCHGGASVFELEKFQRYSIPVLLEYLQKSHNFYREKKLLEIEQSVFNLMIGRIGSFSAVNLIALFYTDYKKELINHFNLEENVLFPYALALNKSAKDPKAREQAIELSQQYSIAKFTVEHTESHKELDRVRESLRLFNPSKSDESALRVLLDQFKSFETDFYLHSLIEDEVLVPKLLKLEQSL
tara:strand:+ start:6317 stop:7057 length:741 start_codon:yes stop_codon:yes gene_type:complete